jgi:hypothetical protein
VKWLASALAVFVPFETAAVLFGLLTGVKVCPCYYKWTKGDGAVECLTEHTGALLPWFVFMWYNTARRGNQLTFDTTGPSTMAMCAEGSLDTQYLQRLGATATFVIEDGRLYLNLWADAGNLVFGAP